MPPEPVPSSGALASEGEPSRKKRSGAVTLMLMAGCGALAYSLARLDPSQREEEVRAYPALQACLEGHLRSAADCRSAYQTAIDLYPRVVPRYATFSACELAHGGGECRFASRVLPYDENTAVPAMAAFVVGVSPEQRLPPQPAFGAGCRSPGLVGDRDDTRYITGSGALLEGPRGTESVVAYGDSARLRAEPDTLRKAVFGGFGETGRNCVRHSSGGG